MEREIDRIIDEFSGRLLRYANSILGNYQDAEDVVQEIFMTVYQQSGKFDGRNLSAWLYKMTYNSCISKIRKRRILPFADVPVSEKPTDVDIGLSDASKAALAKLKPQERALLYGRIVEDYSYDELALQMGQSAATLRKRYERAKQKFAVILKEGFENEKL